jgi:hypothetical protein
MDHQAAAAEYHARTGTADMDPQFLPIFEQCRRFSMTSIERMYALYKATEYVARAPIPGAIVECGVWLGGSMMVVASTLKQLGLLDRDLYLFDTFEGLPRPDTAHDLDIWDNPALDWWLPLSTGDESSHAAEAGLDEVRHNLLSTGYPAERLHFISGMVERTLPDQAPPSIALLRLDTDWYASTRHEMEHLYPRLQRNGVLIIDDYGHYQGARQAVDEYIDEHRLPLLLTRLDYTGRLAVKPG